MPGTETPQASNSPTDLNAIDEVGCTDCKLRQLARAVSRHMDGELRPLGLRASQYSLLLHLDETGPGQLNRIAKVMRLEPSTVSRTVQTMVDAGWLEVLPGRDRRMHAVHLTSHGKAKRRSASLSWESAHRKLERSLGTQTFEQLNALLDQSLQLLED